MVVKTRKETIMSKKNSEIGVGSVIGDFVLISYDEDSGHMLIRKSADDGSEWYEPVAISIPDLFYMFRVEGVDPVEMVEKTCFEFHKVQVEIGNLTQAPFDDDFDACSESYYYQINAIRP